MATNNPKRHTRTWALSSPDPPGENRNAADHHQHQQHQGSWKSRDWSPPTQVEPSSAPRPSFVAESEPPLPQRGPEHRPKTPSPDKPLTRRSGHIGPPTTTTTANNNPTPTPTTPPFPASPSLPLTTPLTLHSPPPPTSDTPLHPEDLITDVLARLASSLNLAQRFQPTSQTRPLRPFERGYWLVDCRGWDAALKRSAWGFLASYLAKGAAGWGTSCTRDAGFAWLRVYCWGGVVGHMYLVLYLMSRRRVLETGAEWVGAEGTAVVVVAARAAKAPAAEGRWEVGGGS
ncbi:hypothetical protein CHGG_02818 [Chaetomium globosum CBS 148.51]|uniref:Uncharacterized protein n=1 Tax=Chaetomium globosum (strain ATCC 6205 / CBS 148.51 / DSM 1962 / NBRC 6347 / NRRL 1970) TaxID=306901 RepID=Q2HAD6_CHAGB|nr:uncharacterized protein CHGG_02818 [Chaetomium globosum CBS 148.51]EAQ90883.1 hypothetical protein CHGG_02818 [Chaetomium globosum CBS 148.51]